MSNIDYDYWETQAVDDMPGLLSQRELAEVIEEMTPQEFAALNTAFREYNHDGVDSAIRKSITRQYDEKITLKAEELHREFHEMLKEDVRNAA